MKPVQARRERRGVSLAVAMLAVLICFGVHTHPALAQAPGAGLPTQPASSAQSGGSTPWYTSIFTGSSEPFFDLRESQGLINGLSVSGFISNTTGMWVDSSAIRYQKSKNSLATERNWLQADINYVLNGDNRFFIRAWGVYEPAYPFEYDAGLTDMSDYYNQYTVRDAYWKNTTGPLTLFLGRQIVTWGESLAFRVGDVINPQDFSWNFGFANLEQSRLPLWMVHPILNLPKVGPFASNFIEGIWTPAWQPMYTQMDTPNQNPADPHSNFYDGQHDVAGSVSVIAPFNLVAGARFGPEPYPLLTGAAGVPANMSAFPQLCGSFVGRHCTSPAFSTFASPFFGYRLPGNNLGSSTEGFRIHTLVMNSEITALYFHGHQFNEAGAPGAPFYVVGSPSTGQFLQVSFPQFNDIGVTLNRPIYLPGAFLSSVPFVLRTEAIWQDRTPFNTTDVNVRNGVVDKNTISTLVALDMDGLYAPWLTSTGTLTTNLEWNNYTITGYGKNLVYDFYAERWRHNEEQILFSVNTSWWWGAILPTYTMIWNPSGNTNLLFPTITLTPPWTNKYFVTIGYIGILGNDKNNSFSAGVFKGKSILLMQWQYNFTLAQGKQR